MGAPREHALTKQQQEAVMYRGRDLLIRGIPGSGKTTVLLRRARRLAEEEGAAAGQIVVFTFNRSLAKFSRELVAKLDNPGIEVASFDSWAIRLCVSWRVRTARR